MAQLKIQRVEVGDFAVYRLSGEFVVSTLLDLRKMLNSDMAKERNFFALDMAGVTLIDSSAMGLVNNIKKRTDEKNGQLVLFSVPSIVSDNLQQIGITASLVIVKNEAEFRENFLI
jgi:anti-anti-sigma factor